MTDTLTVRRVSATPGALIPMDALRSDGPTYSKLVDPGAKRRVATSSTK